MIRGSPADTTGTIDLLDENEPDQLVGKCHPGQREHKIGMSGYGRGEAKGSADEK